MKSEVTTVALAKNTNHAQGRGANIGLITYLQAEIWFNQEKLIILFCLILFLAATAAKRMKENEILFLAHLTGKASTDAIYEKVVSTAGELRWFAVYP